MPQGKKYKAAVATYDVESFFEPQAALAKVKSMATAKFDETIELAVRLGLDPRKADQAVRGTVALPSGTGKTVRVAVFAAGEAAEAARAAGADIVGTDELAAQQRQRAQQAPTSSEPTNSQQRSRRARWTSTSRSQLQTSCRWSESSVAHSDHVDSCRTRRPEP